FALVSISARIRRGPRWPRRNRAAAEVVTWPSANTIREHATVPDRDGSLCRAHHLSRKLKGLGHDARLMPAKYVRPYSPIRLAACGCASLPPSADFTVPPRFP